MEKVKIGVVGAGWWSNGVHLPAIAAHPQAELVVIGDSDLARAESTARRFGAQHWTSDITEFNEFGIDCAVVATPHDAHFLPASSLLKAGVDVLIEKPMTIEPDEAWKLVGLAEASGARLHVGYPVLHSKQASLLRRFIQDGELGEVVMFDALYATAVQSFYLGDLSVQALEGAKVSSRADTYASVAKGGGQLNSQTTHAVALLLWALEDAIGEVFGISTIGRAGSKVDVANVISGHTHAGTLLSISSTGTVHSNAARTERFTLFGSEGHLVFDSVNDSLISETPNRGRSVLADSSFGSANATSAPAACLIDCFINEKPPVVSGYLGAQVVEVLWAARKSAATGLSVSPSTAWRPKAVEL